MKKGPIRKLITASGQYSYFGESNKMSTNTISQKVDFGKAIRAAQAGSHTRISDIAKEIGVAPQQVSRWQKSEDIKLSRAVEIAAVFGMSLADFLDCYHD